MMTISIALVVAYFSVAVCVGWALVYATPAAS